MGCPQKFRSNSDKVQHWELGHCQCGINATKLHQLALECSESRHYAVAEYEEYIRQGSSRRPPGKPCRLPGKRPSYKCPWCESRCNSRAAALKHMASPKHNKPM